MSSITPNTQTVEVAPNGDLFDRSGNLVPLKPTKAVIGGVLGFASMLTTGLTAVYTDSPILVIVNIVVGSAATVLGIYLPSNGLSKHRA